MLPAFSAQQLRSFVEIFRFHSLHVRNAALIFVIGLYDRSDEEHSSLRNGRHNSLKNLKLLTFSLGSRSWRLML
jgi:hypothetical protein